MHTRRSLPSLMPCVRERWMGPRPQLLLCSTMRPRKAGGPARVRHPTRAALPALRPWASTSASTGQVASRRQAGRARRGAWLRRRGPWDGHWTARPPLGSALHRLDRRWLRCQLLQSRWRLAPPPPLRPLPAHQQPGYPEQQPCPTQAGRQRRWRQLQRRRCQWQSHPRLCRKSRMQSMVGSLTTPSAPAPPRRGPSVQRCVLGPLAERRRAGCREHLPLAGGGAHRPRPRRMVSVRPSVARLCRCLPSSRPRPFPPQSRSDMRQQPQPRPAPSEPGRRLEIPCRVFPGGVPATQHAR